MATTTPNRHTTKLTLPSDTEIQIVRAFDARRSTVFDAWTKPDWVRVWYGCVEQKMTTCEIDFRVGGKWRWVLNDPQTNLDHAFSGEYQTIARPEHLAYSERYENIPGSDHGVDLKFEEQQGVTTLTMRIIHGSKQIRDGHLQSGMDRGLELMFARLDELIARANATAA